MLISQIREAVRARKRKNEIEKWKRNGCPAPPPHPVKQAAIEFYQSASGYQVLVETGTFRGDMVEAQRIRFSHIYSIELSEKLWAEAAKRFKVYENISIIQGDSGKVLGDIVNKLDQPAIFWLDGHYSAGETARGDKDCPIYEELNAILANKNYKHILLVDDARLFNGQGDYPTVADLTAFIKNKNSAYQCEVKDDIIRFTIQ